MRHTNAIVTINKANAHITHNDVIKLAVGYRVIYLEYIEDNEIRIRAYGRREFNTLTITNPANETSVVVLRGEEFKRIDAEFEMFYVQPDDEANENTEAEVEAPENTEA